MKRAFSAIATFILLLTLISSSASIQSSRKTTAVYIPFADARQTILTLAEILPDELKDKTENEIATAWPAWVARYDSQIRARLAQGDEDSTINFLLFGTSFTKQPRLTLAELKSLNAANANVSGNPVIAARIRDLVRAVALPGSNDRLSFARKVLAGKGINLATAAGKLDAEKFLAAGLQRVMAENGGYARTLEAARLQGDATEEFAERSRLFRARGLSSDTSLLPNYAIEESLKEIKRRGLLSSPV